MAKRATNGGTEGDKVEGKEREAGAAGGEERRADES